MHDRAFGFAGEFATAVRSVSSNWGNDSAPQAAVPNRSIASRRYIILFDVGGLVAGFDSRYPQCYPISGSAASGGDDIDPARSIGWTVFVKAVPVSDACDSGAKSRRVIH